LLPGLGQQLKADRWQLATGYSNTKFAVTLRY
jgi:hypothetical protein